MFSDVAISYNKKSSPEGSREKTLQEGKPELPTARRRCLGGGGDSARRETQPEIPLVAGADSIGIAAGRSFSRFVGGVVAAGVAAGSIVSVFCSHAARSAAPASMQMYFFIFRRPILV